MSNDNEKLINKLINEGYYELISTTKFVPPIEGSERYEFVKIMLNEETKDFKILYENIKIKEPHDQHMELSIEQAEYMLEKNHPILISIKSIIAAKDLDEFLANKNKPNKKLKL